MSPDLGAVRVSCVRSEGSRLAWGVQEQLSSMSHLVSNLIPSTVYHYTVQCTLNRAVVRCLPCAVSYLVLQPLIWWDDKLQAPRLLPVSAEGCNHS